MEVIISYHPSLNKTHRINLNLFILFMEGIINKNKYIYFILHSYLNINTLIYNNVMMK